MFRIIVFYHSLSVILFLKMQTFFLILYVFLTENASVSKVKCTVKFLIKSLHAFENASSNVFSELLSRIVMFAQVCGII